MTVVVLAKQNDQSRSSNIRSQSQVWGLGVVMLVCLVPDVNLLNRLNVLELLPLQPLCCFFLWRNRLPGNRIYSNHKLFGHRTALSRDLKYEKYIHLKRAKASQVTKIRQEMWTLANSSIPSGSFPQTHRRPIPAVCVAGCCRYTGATCCPAGPLQRCHSAPSHHLPKSYRDRH